MRATAQPVMRSAAHRLHEAMHADFESRGAWTVPATYGDQVRELELLREGLGFADVSARGKLQLSGALEGTLQTLTGRALEPGDATAIAAGGVAARIARDWALALLPPSGEQGTARELKSGLGPGAAVTDLTSGIAGYLVGGPQVGALLSRTVTVDAVSFAPGRCIATSWARVPAVMVVRDLPTPVVEIYVGSEYGRYAWETLRQLGEELGGRPAGWRALDALGWT
jgi:glycine cleavage system aminomethyltransferase T